MDRYLIVSPHTEQGCKNSVVAVESIGFITHFDWGCKDGEHCGWAIVEADSKSEALLSVPSFDRPNARAIRLAKFSVQDVRNMQH